MEFGGILYSSILVVKENQRLEENNITQQNNQEVKPQERTNNFKN